jgi:DNA-binding transcriptional LysR family regulator
LAERMSKLAPRAQFEIVSWHENAFEDTAHGKIDAVLWSNRAPPPLRSEEVLVNDMVCVMSAGHPLARRRMTMESYLSYPHVVIVTVVATGRNMVDDQLAAAGHRRRVGMRVPYFGSAVLAVEKTTMIATIPRIATVPYARQAQVRITEPPFKCEPARILMSWHPSTDGEPSLRWFRGLVGEIGGRLP